MEAGMAAGIAAGIAAGMAAGMAAIGQPRCNRSTLSVAVAAVGPGRHVRPAVRALVLSR